ncbi:MAG: DUF2442 domain-containing protein [Treponema sp.]|nr:DUF2442 domain-containing protein [Treponema sp.]
MNAVWTVKSVEPLENYKILITFEQNVKKIFDMKPYLNYPMYKPLEDISLFNSVSTNGQTVVWNDEIDIAPETLFENGTICNQNGKAR